MAENDRDLRNVILILISALKLNKSRALSLNRALAHVMKSHPTKRSAMTEADVQELLKEFRRLAEADVQDEAKVVEQALHGSGEFLEKLRVYASKQHWK